jgi:hypothetical protein
MRKVVVTSMEGQEPLPEMIGLDWKVDSDTKNLQHCRVEAAAREVAPAREAAAGKMAAERIVALRMIEMKVMYPQSS